MNKPIVIQWIDALKEFKKVDQCRHLRFPMFIESMSGDLLSPEGVLCNLHAKAGLGKWLPEEGSEGGKRLRGCVHYDFSYDVAPESVLKWVGLPASTLSEVRRANGNDGFDGAIRYLEALL